MMYFFTSVVPEVDIISFRATVRRGKLCFMRSLSYPRPNLLRDHLWSRVARSLSPGDMEVSPRVQEVLLLLGSGWWAPQQGDGEDLGSEACARQAPLAVEGG